MVATLEICLGRLVKVLIALQPRFVTSSLPPWSMLCKIENKSHFICEKFLIFDLVFQKITIFLFFEGYFLGNFQKNRSQKPSMLEENQGQFWNLHQIPNKNSNPNFFFISGFFWTKKK